ncbi:uncharacterized protein LOC136771713 isoform X2 [Amia ocellicauda]|uniref:uncharacterized protein LOC136771713 isoform X2 n=1 Tax=Amia ocellicauda TaxID=2972642 RepID=UPI0034640A7B
MMQNTVIVICTLVSLSHSIVAQRVYTSVGGTALLPCRDRRAVEKAGTVQWEHTAVEGVQSRRVLTEGRFTLKARAALQISNVQLSDAGIYYCGQGAGSDLLVLQVTSDPSDPLPDDWVIVTCDVKCPRDCGHYILKMNSTRQTQPSGAPPQDFFQFQETDRGKTFRCWLEVNGLPQTDVSFGLAIQNHTGLHRVAAMALILACAAQLL